jgi:hypothetical protein
MLIIMMQTLFYQRDNINKQGIILSIQIDTSDREREITIWKYIFFIKLFGLSFNIRKLINFLTLTNDLFFILILHY